MFRSIRLRSGKIKLYFILAFAFIVALVAFPSIGIEGIKRGLQLSYTTMIPALFPFLFIIDYVLSLCNYAVYNTKHAAAKKSGRRLRIAMAVCFSFIGGFPLGARALSNLVDQGVIDNKKAARLLAGCVNSGPAFVIGSIGFGLLGSYYAGLFLFISLSLASALCLLAFNLRKSEPNAAASDPKPLPLPLPAPPSFVDSVAAALKSVATVCSFIVLFSCIIQYVFAAATNLCYRWGFDFSPVAQWALGSVLEVTTACQKAGEIGSLLGFYLSGACISLCSLSILFQIYAIVKRNTISLKPLLLSRLLHLPATLLILRALAALFPRAFAVFFTVGDATISVFYSSPLFSFFLLLVGAVFVATNRRPELSRKNDQKTRRTASDLPNSNNFPNVHK